MKLNIISISSVCLFLSSLGLLAQNPAVGVQMKNQTAFINSEIYTGTGEVIKNGILVVEKGKILDIGSTDLISKYPNAIKVDVKGKHIYPGIISPNNQLGLNEIAAVRTTQDYQEIGKFNPNVRALIAYNTDSEVIPTVRGNGVLITQVTPEGGTIPGRSSVMNLDGWNWEDAVLKADDGVWLNWPAKMANSFNMETFTRERKKNEKYAPEIEELNTFFTQAKNYQSNPKDFENLKFSALADVFTSTTRLYINVGGEKEVLDAISFCKKFEIKYPVIVGEVSSEIALNMLKESNIPVLLPTTHRIPESVDADVWEAYKLPAKLFAKGILVGMYYNESYWRTRNLPYVAGNAAGHGLTKAEALKMITLNNAKILGIDKMVGSLEKGKNATFIISTGDILDMRTSKVEQAFINGAEVNLDDKQKRLAEKYNSKYGIK
jgi:imidazolonepropionase-like amidohydrolase